MKIISIEDLFLLNLKRFFLIMRIALFFNIITAIMVFGADTYSQTQKFSLSFENATLKEIFDAIEDQSEFIFFYQDQQVDLSRKIDIEVSDADINNILKRVFEGTDNIYIIRDRQIVIGERKVRDRKENPPESRNERESELLLPVVSGRVTDASTGDPLPGVNIIIEGTLQGTITDVDGNYILDIPEGSSVLVFSYIGYETFIAAVSGETTLDVRMVPDIKELSEVVVVGYGTQKKINLSGAVDVISANKLQDRPVANVVEALQGVSPNLNVLVNTDGGEPGAKMDLNIRGLGSISGNSGNPFILVDGIEQSIYNINPEDIESISVLKDAAASSIYGARAAFGVILVTTKKGQKDGVSLSYSNNFSFAKPINLPELTNSLDFANYFNEASANDGNAPVFQPIIIENIIKYQAGELEDWTQPIPWMPNLWLIYQGGWANTDWFDVDYKDWVPRQTHNLSVSGGNSRTQYYVSGAIFNQEGLLSFGNDNFSRKNLNLKLNTTVYDWLRFNFISKFSHTNLNRPSYDKNLFYHNIARRWPTNGVYFPDGNLNYAGEQLWLQTGGRYDNNNNELSLIPGIELEPLKDWIIYANYRWRFNYENYTNHEAKVYGTFVDGSPSVLRPNNYFAMNSFESYYNSPNIYSSFHRNLNSHDFTLLAGFEQEELNYKSNFSRKDDLISDEIPSLGTATGKEYASGTMGHWSTRSYFGRLNYNFKEKYLVEFSGRRDGSSRFDTDRRWGTFLSGSMAYVISKEPFWKAVENVVNVLKFRSSYGSLGNQDVENYLYIERLPVLTNLPYIIGGERPNYVGMPGLSSPNLTWETINTLNFGIDMGFLENRLVTSADYYIRNTYEMLGPVESLPAVLGTAVPQTNNATLKTSGFEVVLGWRETRGDLNYSATFMLADAKSEVMEYYNPEKLLSAPFYEGKQVGEIWGFTTVGLFQTDEEARNWDQSFLSGEQWRAGDVRYADLNEDNKIDIGKNTVDDHGDLSIIGNFMPRYSYSFILDASWKGIDFRMLWQGIAKRDLWLNGSHFWGATGGIWQATAFDEHLDYWREDNPDAYFPRPYLDKGAKNRQVQTRYLQDGSYLRFKSLQVGYTLPSRITKKAYIGRLRIYATGENLLTFTKLSKVFDPEALEGVWGSGKIYPLQMNLSFGVNVTF